MAHQETTTGRAEAGLSAPTGWRGRRAQAADVIRHRWQKDWTARPADHLRFGEGRRRFKVAGASLLLVALVAFFVYYLLYAPAQTPVLIIAPGEGELYRWPLAPCGWTSEDLAKLADLDGRTLNVIDLSPDWRGNNTGLTLLDGQLRQIAEQGTRSGAVVLYVSLHGAVDGRGRPCLLLPSASPVNSDTWLALEDLLARIGSYEQLADVHKLVLLDCNRIQVDWKLGQAYNTFADELAAAVRRADVPNLVVINSSAAGQIGSSSADLQASVFGHFVRLGLAGAADAEGTGLGGGNRRVSLRELHRYLVRHVDRWARLNRGLRQQPLLVPADAADFDVAWALKPRSLRWVAAAAAETVRTKPPVGGAQINALWQAQERLAESAQPYRLDPIAWRDVQGQLLWLEQAVESGAAYAAEAINMHSRLHKLLIDDDGSAFQENSETLYAPVTPHSLPMAESYRKIDAARADRLRAALEQGAVSPTLEGLDGTIATFQSAEGEPPLAEAHFLRLLRRDHGPGLWQRPDVLQAAVRVRNRSLAAGTQRDERAHYFLRADLASADALRRRAENSMVLGGTAALDASAADWNSADARYGEVGTLAAQVAQAFEFRDRTLAELPHTALWLARPLPEGTDPAVWDRAINETLPRLIARLDGVSRAIDEERRADNDESPSADDLIAQSADVEQLRKELSGLMDAEAVRLLSAKQPGAAEYRDIDQLLVVPSLPADVRDKLRRRRHRLAVNLHGSFSDAQAGDVSPQDDVAASNEGQTTPYLERMTAMWTRHPALAMLEPMLGPGESADEPSTDVSLGDRTAACAQIGHQIRTLLAGVPRRVEALHEASSSPTPATAEGTGQQETALSQSERIVRSAAPLWFPPPGADPILELRRHDLANLLLWQGRRALDDMWGAASAGEPPFFAVAAGDYFQSARQLAGTSGAAAGARDDQEARLETLRAAVRDGLRVSATDIPLIDELENAQSTVAVHAGPEDLRQALPAEAAALFLSDPLGRLVGASRAVTLPLASEAAAPSGITEQFQLAGPSLAGRGPNMEATLLVRGNRFTAPFLLRPPTGIRVIVEPYVYPDPTVTVLGGRQRASVVFVLDCSNTMAEPTEMIEGPDAAPSTRMEAAKYALAKMMARLAAEGNSRVGVRLFGHRAGWHRTRPGEILYQDGYARHFDRPIDPAADVEQVLRLGRFDSVQAGGIQRLLDSAVPWGQSPLYLALVEAAGDFAGEGVEAAKSIVVITDGDNYQFNAEIPTTADAVLAAATQAAVPIHIVQFTTADGREAEALKQLQEVAIQTGGSYVPVAGATALVERLESLLGTNEYRVVPSAGGPPFGPVRIGTPVVVSLSPSEPREFTVMLETIAAEIELAGGEAAQLIASADGRTLESVRYKLGSPKFAPLIDPARPADDRLLAGVHRPIAYPEGIAFSISLQHADRQFVGRLPDVWIEITPLSDDGSRGSPTYTFCDVNYEPETPVPLLTCLAEDWPGSAPRAEVNVWCKSRKTVPTWSIPLDPDDAPSDVDRPLDGLDGVSYQVRARRGAAPGDPLRVIVIERHETTSPGLNSLRVETVPRGRRIVHRYDAASRRVVHIFQLDPLDVPRGEGLTLQFTSRTEMQAGARRLIEPVVVDVSSTDDVIQIGPRLGRATRPE